MTLNSLQDLRAVLDRLNAERPAAVNPRAEQTPYAERGGKTFERLDLELVSRPGQARILVSGQIGVGKSSELLNYANRYKAYNRGYDDTARGALIFCDLEKEEHPERCSATGAFLTVFRDCWAATYGFSVRRPDLRPELSNIRNDTLSRMTDWLKGEYSDDRQKILFRFGGMDFPIFLDRDRDSALALILGKAAQHEAVSQPSERFGSAPDSLINLLNRLLDWYAVAFGSPPIVIVDHVDKIRDPIAAEDVLIKAVTHWNRLKASIVMTAPFEYTLGALRNSVESKWGRPIMVYPIEMPDLSKADIPSIFTKIVRNAYLDTLIRPDALKLLTHYSGGVLRTFVQFLNQACKEAYISNHDKIELSDAEVVVNDAQRAYQDYTAADLELLNQLDQKQTGLREATTLLRSPIGLLVSEPRKNEQALVVHPLAMAALEKYRLKHSRPSSG